VTLALFINVLIIIIIIIIIIIVKNCTPIGGTHAEISVQDKQRNTTDLIFANTIY